MKTSFHLYGVTPNVYEHLPYREALCTKLLHASNLIDTLVAVNFEDRDDERLQDVIKAVKHTENLLAELDQPSSSGHTSIEEFVEPSIEETSKFC